VVRYIPWEIVLARHYDPILASECFLFQSAPKQQTTRATKIVESVSKNDVCAALIEKSGKMQVKIYSTELQLCISHLAWKGNMVVKQPSSNLPIIFGSRLSAIVNLF